MGRQQVQAGHQGARGAPEPRRQGKRGARAGESRARFRRPAQAPGGLAQPHPGRGRLGWHRETGNVRGSATKRDMAVVSRRSWTAEAITVDDGRSRTLAASDRPLAAWSTNAPNVALMVHPRPAGQRCAWRTRPRARRPPDQRDRRRRGQQAPERSREAFKLGRREPRPCSPGWRGASTRRSPVRPGHRRPRRPSSSR